MINSVGKFFLFVVFVSGCWVDVHALVELRLLDMRHRALEDIETGTACNVEVIMSGSDATGEHYSDLTIDNPSNLAIIGQQTGVQIINGQRTNTFTYTLLPGKAGDYVFGPARFSVNGVEKKSKIMTLHVVDPVEKNPDDGPTQKIEPVFTRVQTDTAKGVVGVKIIVSLKVYCYHDATEIREIVEPLWGDHVKVGKRTGPLRSAQTVNGIVYTCLEWQWELFPTQAGQLTIPSFRSDFNVPSREGDHGDVRDFFSLFRQHYEHKRVYSNAVTLSILPLPPHNGAVNAVGIFDNLTLDVKPAVAQEGEGILLTLAVDALQGGGDIKEFSCQGIPDALKWYDSKITCTQLDDHKERHAYEYVLQGLKVGKWKIPSQKFTYFDVERGTYVTLTTGPKTITILKNAAKDHTKSVDEQVDDQKVSQQSTATSPTRSIHDETSSPEHEKEKICPINTTGPWADEQERIMPWWLVLLLLVSALFLLYKKYIYNFFSSSNFLSKKGATKKIFHKAKKALRNAQSKNQVEKIHLIFIDFLSHLLSVSPAKLTQENIEQYLQARGFSDQSLDTWHKFFVASMEATYCPDTSGPGGACADKLFASAFEWLVLIGDKA